MLSWNLYHGRAKPPAGRPLAAEFARALAGWEWDVALLQEVPPWWPAQLGGACDAHARWVLTSRNGALPARRAIAARAPDLLKANGGGANAILVRGAAPLAHRWTMLRRVPERRIAHGVQLAGGVWVANLHASVQKRAPLDVAGARAAALAWSAGGPVVLGGDLNTPRPAIPGFIRAAHRHVDGIWARGLEPVAPGRTLERGTLSDHAPILAELSARAAARSRAA